MALSDDGDLIRGVGYVAIYSAYLEEAIDNLLESLDVVDPIDDRLAKAQAGEKIRAIRRRLAELDPDGFVTLKQDLDVCSKLLDTRHDIIHGRIYAEVNGPAMLHPGRPGREKRPASSIELYDVANQLFTCCGCLARPLIFEVPDAIARWRAA